MDVAIPEETLGDRMRRALRKEHLGVQDIADYLGVSRNTVSTWINDRIHPSEQTLKLWAIRTGVPEEWLKEGDAAPSFPAPPARGTQHNRRQRKPVITRGSRSRCHHDARNVPPLPVTQADIDATISGCEQLLAEAALTTRGI